MTGIGLFTFGIVSTLPMGPAGMNVAASALKKRSFPLKAFLGFLVAETMYLGLAFGLKDLMLTHLEIWKVVTSLVAGVFILGFGIHIVQKTKQKQINPNPSGFVKSFMITAGNPGILLLHLTVLLQVQTLATVTQVQLVASFLLGGLLTIIAIVYGLLLNKNFFLKHGNKVEFACGIVLLLMGAVVLQKAVSGMLLL